MTDVQIINFVDLHGGLMNAFGYGLKPSDAESPLREILEKPWYASLEMLKGVSEFYDYAESCAFEEEK